MSFSGPNINIHDLLSPRRRTVAAPKNPLDKSTVVSIFPKEIDENKVTVFPGRFHVDAGTYDKPAVLVVGSSSWWREIDADQPLLEIPQSSVLMAESIVKDWANGLLGCNMNDKMPGVFFLMGAFTSADVKDKHKAMLDVALGKQKAWYMELVKMGDILWARTNGNPLAIDDNMRLAAQELNMKDKPWLKDFTTVTLVNCAACGQLRNPAYPICNHCRNVIDQDLYKKLNLKVG